MKEAIMDKIDVDLLREDLQNNLMGAFFGGGFGGAFMEALDITKMSDEEVIELATTNGIDVSAYIR